VIVSDACSGRIFDNIREKHFLSFFFQGRRCVLNDCCMIADNSIVPPETIVPTFSVFSGNLRFSMNFWTSQRKN